MLVNRSKSNPIVTPDMVKPSRAGFRVDGTFNAGVIDCDGEIVMLLRVAESAPSNSDNDVNVPVLAEHLGSWNVSIKTFQRDDPRYDFSDARTIVLKEDPRQAYLTSMSHIRVARSSNGTDFVVDDEALIFPDNRNEAYGCEDPRITLIEGVYYINYSSVSDLGISTSLARSTDFKQVEKLGVIFAPDNRDVCFFSEKSQWLLLGIAPSGSVASWQAGNLVRQIPRHASLGRPPADGAVFERRLGGNENWWRSANAQDRPRLVADLPWSGQFTALLSWCPADRHKRSNQRSLPVRGSPYSSPPRPTKSMDILATSCFAAARSSGTTWFICIMVQRISAWLWRRLTWTNCGRTCQP